MNAYKIYTDTGCDIKESILEEWGVGFCSLSFKFEKEDRHFVEKHGQIKARYLVFQHYKKTNLPFIYDTYQLSCILGITRKKLFDLSKNANELYKEIKLPKKNGGFRTIHAPTSYLKEAQRQILRMILSKISISEYATAYRKGMSLSDNAFPHIGHRYLLKMDITDFFGSITFKNVLSTAFPSSVYPKQIGVMLTSLCSKDGVLPQGAPTSPYLSNIVMKTFDEQLGKWCKDHGITYTRYCDDMTFSANVPLYNLSCKVEDMLRRWGFEANTNKTHFIQNTSSQIVTGLVVNEKVSIPRDYKRDLRQEIYYAIKFGLRDSIINGKKDLFIHNGNVDTEGYFNHLMGKLKYVLQIEPKNEWFIKAEKNLISICC